MFPFCFCCKGPHNQNPQKNLLFACRLQIINHKNEVSCFHEFSTLDLFKLKGSTLKIKFLQILTQKILCFTQKIFFLLLSLNKKFHRDKIKRIKRSLECIQRFLLNLFHFSQKKSFFKYIFSIRLKNGSNYIMKEVVRLADYSTNTLSQVRYSFLDSRPQIFFGLNYQTFEYFQFRVYKIE